MMKTLLRACGIGALILAVNAGAGAANAQSATPLQKVTLAVPNITVLQGFAYVADAMGYWKDQGLNVDVIQIAGPASTDAMLAGDVEFSEPSGLTLLTAHAKGQKLIAIAGIYREMAIELAISKDAAAKTGLTVANSTVAQRAKALKGMTLAPDQAGSILDGYLRYVVGLGGLNPDRDVTISPVVATATLGAMDAKRIDGFVQGPPWTTTVQQKGTGVIWISGVRGDLTELSPFAFNTIAARADYCDKNPTICREMVSGIQRAFAFMKSNPDKSLQILAAKFKDMDPALLKIAFDEQIPMLFPDAQLTDASLANTQKFGTAAGFLKPDQQLGKFDSVVFTDKYAK